MPLLSARLLPAGLAAAALAPGCGPGLTPADLVLRGGRVVTLDEANPEGQALAITGYRVTAVGSDADIQRYVGPDTEVIELAGRLAIPGFIEGHGHFMGLGEAKLTVDLTAAGSWDDVLQQVEQAVRRAEPGAWVTGRGWHQEKWSQVPEPAVEGVPVNDSLDAVSPGNPVLLTHASGHAAFANDRALAAAGIGRDTPDPAGGTIVRDSRGDATGLLRETAQRLVGEALERARAARPPELIEMERRRMVEEAGLEALSKGITSFQDAGSSFATIDFLKGLADSGELPVRLYVMVRGESNPRLAERLPGYRILPEGNAFLSVRSIKRQIDGALGAHGAWLLEPYADHETTGLVLEPVEDIEETARIAIEHGFQVNTHAIGDRANREVLDLYQRVFEAHPDRTGLRWRIEHAQHLHPDDVPRFAALGVIASMQGIHCTSDAPWVPRRLGEERAAAESYLWRSLLDSGAVVTNGTDAPVEDVDPIASFYATVTRRLADGSVFLPEQRLSRLEALRSYTLANAYAAFEEGIKGSLAPGKLADVAVLSLDVLEVPEHRIPEARVDLTIVGGDVRFRR
jgi:hypothetical protein